MRRKRDTQSWMDFQPSSLKLTNDYFSRYEAVSRILDDTPKLLDLVHGDLRKALESENRQATRRGSFRITSEMVLRLSLCQVIEGLSLRAIVIRVDDSCYLRRFTRIHDGPMMNYTALCRLRNAIQPETWKKVNHVLAEYAVAEDMIHGEKLRLDTTAVETNIHWPTDSSLLWDGYRTLGRLICAAREIDPRAVGDRRVHLKRTKKIVTKIARLTRAKGRKAKDAKYLYQSLIRQVEGICVWATEVVSALERGLASGRYGLLEHATVQGLVVDLRHFEGLTRQVVWQSTERVINDRPVPNHEKLFSIFEPHTELLKRGKAGKNIEFGHMIQIQQVAEKFITDFEVFPEKPTEPTLLRPALSSHEKLFGYVPDEITADKGYWSAEHIDEIRGDVKLVSISKMGRRNRLEEEREHDPFFRLAQAFRAGVEGSISFLKRCLGLARCMNKGWRHYASTIGAAVVAHNLLVLARC
jgi:transposase, IS5 family